jgi:hypothetical protein
MELEIMASGPVVKESGMLPRRVVLRVLKNSEGRPLKFVVHEQGWDNGHECFVSGHYFQCGRGGSDIMAAYEKAMTDFLKRVKELAFNHSYDEMFSFSKGQVLTAV